MSTHRRSGPAGFACGSDPCKLAAMTDLSRRTLMAGAAVAAASAAAKAPPASAGSMMAFAAPKLEKVRIGIIGVGERGTPMTDLLLTLDGVEIRAIADTDAFVLDRAVAKVSAAQGRAPARITGGPDAWRQLTGRDDLDAVFIFTPWDLHAPMALAAMKAGKHAFVEVPMGVTIDELWELVETSEATKRHCMMLENCCYGREELMLLNMVRQGLFGELTHGAGAYIHELRGQMLRTERGEGVWRPGWQTRQRGNLYPTHGLGPVAQYMNINRGDRFDYLVAMDSPALGMAAFAQERLPADDPQRNWRFIAGDMSSALVKTVRGRTILVQHDINTPRPYDRLNYIQGTKGAFGGYPARIAIDDGGKAHHKWDLDMGPWQAKYDHPLWSKLAALAQARGGHGGMDFVMLWRVIACLREGLPVDQPVYDGASWSSLFDLTQRSVKNRSAAQDIPDFTRGGWQTAASFDIRV